MTGKKLTVYNKFSQDIYGKNFNELKTQEEKISDYYEFISWLWGIEIKKKSAQLLWKKRFVSVYDVPSGGNL